MAQETRDYSTKEERQANETFMKGRGFVMLHDDLLTPAIRDDEGVVTQPAVFRQTWTDTPPTTTLDRQEIDDARDAYQAAATDSERLQVIADYFGFTLPSRG